MKLLLLSNSGRPYMEYCRSTIAEFLSPVRKVLFVPVAAFIDPQEYFGMVKGALDQVGLEVVLFQPGNQPVDQVERAGAIMVGGGNTYNLLKTLKTVGVLNAIRKKVEAGTPYVGWSAGSNIAGPTILTTNDWNVVGLNDFTALNLVPFNINPHYLESDPASAKHSETRDERIEEYHKANSNTVLGIEEQTWVRAENGTYVVGGTGRVRRFERGQKPVDYRADDTLPI